MPQDNLLEDSFHSDYRSLEEIYAACDNLSFARPSLASFVSLGTTYEGRDIRALCLTNSEITAQKPQFVIDTGYIPCEWGAIATCVYLIKKFVESSILNHCEIYFIPVVNGDGYQYSRDSDRLYRKNRTSPGVDLQKNFAFYWGKSGGSNSPSSENFRGTSAASEIEVQTMQAFFASLTHFKGYINLGSYGQTIASPWGWTADACQNFAEQSRMMAAMASAILSAHSRSYSHASYANAFYLASGNSLDYVYGVHHVLHSYHLRLRDTGTYGYLLPKEQLIPQGEETFAGINQMLTELVQ